MGNIAPAIHYVPKVEPRHQAVSGNNLVKAQLDDGPDDSQENDIKVGFIGRSMVDFKHQLMPQIRRELNEDVEIHSTVQSSFQIVLIDISNHLNKLAKAMLDALRLLAKDSILVFDTKSLINLNTLCDKTTLLFVSSEFASTIKHKSDNIKAIFILHSDMNKVDQRERFATGEDLICQLADELYRCYKKEVGDCLKSGDLLMARIREQQADRIYSDLKEVHQKYFAGDTAVKSSISTTTILIWVKSKLEDETEVEKFKNLLSTIVSSFLVFDSESICRDYLLKNASTGVIFLILNKDYEASLIAEHRQLPNVKQIYRYGSSSLKNVTNIINYNDLWLRLTYDLIAHYNKLGDDCSDNQDAKTAKDMFMKAHDLCKILGQF